MFLIILILEILAVWLAISIITFVICVCVVRFLKRNPANHLPPMPENSILHKRQTGVSQ